MHGIPGLVGRSALIALLVPAMLLVLAGTASATSYRVSIRTDPVAGACTKHNCSLREAISAANAHAGKDTVVLPSHETYKISLQSTVEDANLNGDLDITGPLIVSHPGKGKAGISGNGRDRVFDVQADARTTFRNLRITGGRGFAGSGRSVARKPSARGSMNPPEGGGIRNASTIKVVSSTIDHNTSASHGGGIGAINGAGLELVKSTVTRNHTAEDGDGGGIDGDFGKITIESSKIIKNEADRDGGGVYWISRAPSEIKDSTLSGNRAGSAGGAIDMGPGPDPTPTPLRISGSTFDRNTSANSGGAIRQAGEKLIATNSTFSANRAGSAGGAIATLGGRAEVNAVTVAGNQADSADAAISSFGGGLFVGSSATRFQVENSLIALNRSGSDANDCAGDFDFDSQGHNLLGTLADCGGFDAPGDRARSKVKIGKLADNGGPTKTFALRKGSPAIAKASESSAPGTDQRGKKRDKHPDIGAFER